MAYGIFESINIKGKNFSFQYNADIENGMLVHKGDLITGSRDIYNAVIPTPASMTTEKVCVVGNPAWSYDSSSIINQNEEEYINKANKPFRVYELDVNDKFSIADYSIDTVGVSVGDSLVLQGGSGKLIVGTAGSAFVGKVISIRNMGNLYHVGQIVDQRMNKVTIEVVKNG